VPTIQKRKRSQTLLSLSKALRSHIFKLREVPSTFNVLLHATAWIDLHTTKGCCVKICVIRSRFDSQFYFRVSLLDFANEMTTRRSPDTLLWRKLYQLCEIEDFASCKKSGSMFPFTSYTVSQVRSFET